MKLNIIFLKKAREIVSKLKYGFKFWIYLNNKAKKTGFIIILIQIRKEVQVYFTK
jgi:hypothetical protein